MPGRSAIRTIRRDAAVELTAAKREELLDLARRFGKGRRTYVDTYWQPKFLTAVCDPRLRIVQSQRIAGWLSPDLSAHQNKVCLESSLAILRSSWSTAFATARRVVLLDRRWDGDRDWALATLRSVGAIQECLTTPLRRSTRRQRRLRRLVLRARGRKPRDGGKFWFEIDCNLYRPFYRSAGHFRGAWLAVTGTRRGRRIAVPLAGSSLQMFASRTRRRDSRPNVRVVVGERVVFYVAEWVPCERRPEGRTIGVDKGMNTLLVASDGAVDSAKAFGRDASRQLEEIINTSARRRNRLRIAAYERSIRNSNRSRSRLIRRRNLGRRKQARTRTRESSGLRDFVNRSLNELFEDLGISRIYAEDLTFRPGWPGREINRRLSRWLRGYLQRRLVYKAELNGVELETVNAAYTSQTCPRCWFVAKSNRHGDRFSCSNCGYAGSADAIAATNVRQRGSDSVITRFMSATEVKQTLDARWRSARIGRAWDSNEAISRPSRASTTRIESRTAAGEVQTPPVIHTAALYPPAVVVAEQEAPDAYSVKNASFV